jgi:hypothetical protein
MFAYRLRFVRNLKTTGSKPVESNATESRLKGVAHALLRAAFTIV